ncbi:tRNA pseudouridine synthase, TruD family [Methanomethylovorans hollandica DSM 15978]|uniref:Probable tRNA pseudouridine synthase D n=1 Tax=Methanomethylovorans hollandica (strain DSM 15978 / NBRC 107637 / DMS1) TaxID=867904 RepID=L0KWX4_METHD|nr:tRNA pseudouridine(13) synthase TruD [Methanomethylovorans hollandica]AGB49631.1 tRNA pseudouridine synthase, TruD family [Methanomethylovorans hollandica DSM 15978]
MQVPETEHTIGMELYATTTGDIGGKLRQVPEDFIVKEVSGWEVEASGKHLILELTKRDWDTNHIIRDLSRSLGISQKRIGFAGTKDKRAVTTQRISIFDVTEETIEKVHIKDVQLTPLGRYRRSVELGDLRGNIFQITIRDIDLATDELKQRMDGITSEIQNMGGVPNFFGIQRFGAIRPVTHLVGEALVRGSPEEAAMIYIAASFKDEPQETRIARDEVRNTRDFAQGLRTFPPRLRYERAMMHYLVEHPEDYKGSFSMLTDSMSRMFVHAFQSYIYNRVICARIQAGIPLNQAIEGDIVCFKNSDSLPDTSKTQRVNAVNLEGMNNLIKRGRAFVTAPLFGYNTEMASGISGEIESAIIEELKLTTEEFQLQEIPSMASKGQRREILLNVQPQFKILEDDLNNGKQKVMVEFSLPKGSYATTVLREYMKVDPLKMS